MGPVVAAAVSVGDFKGGGGVCRKEEGSWQENMGEKKNAVVMMLRQSEARGLVPSTRGIGNSGETRGRKCNKTTQPTKSRKKLPTIHPMPRLNPPHAPPLPDNIIPKLEPAGRRRNLGPREPPSAD